MHRLHRSSPSNITSSLITPAIQWTAPLIIQQFSNRHHPHHSYAHSGIGGIGSSNDNDRGQKHGQEQRILFSTLNVESEQWTEVNRLLRRMKECNKSKRYDEAIKIFQDNFRPPNQSQTLAREGEAEAQAVKEMVTESQEDRITSEELTTAKIPADQRVLSCLLQSYARKGNIKKMYAARKMMQVAGMKQEQWTYNVMIQAHIESKAHWSHAWRIFNKMTLNDDKSIRPDSITYVLMIGLFSEWGKLGLCVELFEMWRNDTGNEAADGSKMADNDKQDRSTTEGAKRVYAAMLSAFVRNDRMESAERLFTLMKTENGDNIMDEVIYNIMAECYAKQGKIDEIKQMIASLQEQDISVQYARRNLIECLVNNCDVDSAQSIMKEMEKQMVIDDVKQIAYVYSIMIRGLLDQNRHDDAMLLLQKLADLQKTNSTMTLTAMETSIGLFVAHITTSSRRSQKSPEEEINKWLNNISEKEWFNTESMSPVIDTQRVIALANMGRVRQALSLLRERHQNSANDKKPALHRYSISKAYESIIVNTAKRTQPPTASETFKEIRKLLHEMKSLAGPSQLRKTSNVVLHYFVEKNLHKLAVAFARLMQESGIIYETRTLTKLIESHAAHDGLKAAIDIFSAFYLNPGMQTHDEPTNLMKLEPDNVILSVMMKEFVKKQMFREGIDFHRRITERFKLGPDDFVLSSLVDCLTKGGEMNEAETLVRETFQRRDVLTQLASSGRKRASWAIVINTLLSGYARIGTTNAMRSALKVFETYFMSGRNGKNMSYVRSSQFGGSTALFEPDEYTVSNIVTGLCKAGSLDRAEQFFMVWLPKESDHDEKPRLQLAVAFQSLLKGLCGKNLNDENLARAMHLFKTLCLEKRWIKYNELTVGCIISGYIRLRHNTEALHMFETYFLKPFYQTDKHLTGLKKSNNPHKSFVTLCFSLLGWCIRENRYSDIVRMYPFMRHRRITLTRMHHHEALLCAGNEEGQPKMVLEWFRDIEEPSSRCWLEFDRAMTATGQRPDLRSMPPNEEVFKVQR